ncbi:hypothetical protein SUGI_0909770 [Cryptomeria japonica]|nr:hypothetical protein SUGI_0909770 [Cryptomeria japonica]
MLPTISSSHACVSPSNNDLPSLHRLSSLNSQRSRRLNVGIESSPNGRSDNPNVSFERVGRSPSVEWWVGPQVQGSDQHVKEMREVGVASVEEGLAYFHQQLEDKYPEVSPQPKTLGPSLGNDSNSGSSLANVVVASYHLVAKAQAAPWNFWRGVFSLFTSEKVDKVALSYINFVLLIELGPVSNCTKVVAVVLLAVSGGNSSSSADDIKGILRSIGIDYDEERIEFMLGQLKRKSLALGIALTVYEEEAYTLTKQMTHAQDPLLPVDELKQVLVVSVAGQGDDIIPGYGKNG